MGDAALGVINSSQWNKDIDAPANRSFLLVEHDMDAVFALADRVTVLVSGRAVATGEPHVIRADPVVREAYLGEDA